MLNSAIVDYLSRSTPNEEDGGGANRMSCPIRMRLFRLGRWDVETRDSIVSYDLGPRTASVSREQSKLNGRVRLDVLNGRWQITRRYVIC